MTEAIDTWESVIEMSSRMGSLPKEMVYAALDLAA